MIRIVIAVDQELLRGTLTSILNLEEDMEVVGQVKDGQEALALVHQLKPDLFIMDIEMLERDGPLEAVKTVGCHLLVLTTFPKKGYLERAQQFDAGGYLLKDSPSEELTSSIRSIVEGKRVYSPKLTEEDEESQESGSFHIPHPPGPVKNYFTMIMDKMKSPAG